MKLSNRGRKEFSNFFAKAGQWRDYALYAMIILFFFAMRKDINLWLQRLMGNRLTSIALYLTGNDFLRWLLVLVIVVFTIYSCVKKARDYYRSISGMLLIIAVALVLASSGEYWEYVEIAGPFTFLHLMLLALVAVLVAMFYSPRSRHLIECQSQKCFKVDNVKATVAESDKNRAAYAKNLVERILNTDMSTESFSVGISGSWGSGKSTFLEALRQAFMADKSGKVSVVVEFHPWNGASSGQIVTDFFNVLVGKLGDEYSVLRGPLLKYAELLKMVDAKRPSLYLAELLDKKRKTSIGETKKLISGFLRQYNRVVPVLIDDLDRLTADEIADVLKLIRNTADFPNIVYIAAYDKGYVCEVLETVRKIERPSVYLEKFFSVELVLPKLEDQYQYKVLADEIKAMNPHAELWQMVENMSNGVIRLFCKHFGNFRQVKRFARIFVHDCEYFLQRHDAARMIDLSDMFLLKMLAFLDANTYRLLEQRSSSLIVGSDKLWYGFKPLELRPGVLGETVSDVDKKTAYTGEPLPEATREVLEFLFLKPSRGRKKTCFINPESAPIYFMLNIPSRTIHILDVNRAILGDLDVETQFDQWTKEEKLSSLYNHLIGLKTNKMTLEQAKRYLFLCLSIFPYVVSVREITEYSLLTNKYVADFYDGLNAYAKVQVEKLIEKTTSDMFKGYNRLMKCFSFLYQEQFEVEYNNEDRYATLLGSTDDIVAMASKTFLAYAQRFGCDADDVLMEDSLTRSILEDAVVSFNGDKDCVSLIADAMIDYFHAHKGKNKEVARHYFDMEDDTSIGYVGEALERKHYEMVHIFGSKETYKKFVVECFEEE